MISIGTFKITRFMLILFRLKLNEQHNINTNYNTNNVVYIIS